MQEFSKDIGETDGLKFGFHLPQVFLLMLLHVQNVFKQRGLDEGDKTFIETQHVGRAFGSAWLCRLIWDVRHTPPCMPQWHRMAWGMNLLLDLWAEALIATLAGSIQGGKAGRDGPLGSEMSFRCTSINLSADADIKRNQNIQLLGRRIRQQRILCWVMSRIFSGDHHT